MNRVPRPGPAFSAQMRPPCAATSFDPHVGLLRGWALALPAAAVWWVTRPAPLAVLRAPAAARPLPQAA